MSRSVRRSAFRVIAVAPVLLLAFAYCRDGADPTSPAGPAAVATFDVGPSGTAVLVGASDVGTCSTNNDELTAQLLDAIDGTIMLLGDGAYAAGSPVEYETCFGPTWGRHKARIRPAPGERDYATPGAAGYFGYFGDAAGSAAEGWYSYDLGEWHVVVLNTEVPMSEGSPQLIWLAQDLLAHTNVCTVAYWHDARFFSGTPGIRTALEPAWKVLYAAGADVIVNGHTRFYERFAPQRPDEVADPAYGIRQFIVGVGGAGTSAFTTRRPNSEVLDRNTFGVLKLTLGSGTYDWEFVPIAGKTFTDSGTGSCHGPPPPIANPGGPYSSEATVVFNGSASVDLQGNEPLAYTWDFGDGTSGTGDRPTHTYTADGSYTVTLTVTDAIGDVSVPAATTVTIANLPPVVQAGFDQTAFPGQTITVTGRFTDGLVKDSPWTFRITWGDGIKTVTGKIQPHPKDIVRTHTYKVPGDYTVTVTVTDAEGATGSDQMIVRVRPAGTPFVLMGAGDIATCGTIPLNLIDDQTAMLLDQFPDAAVFTAGDNAYPHGSAADYANCYHPSWGRHRDRTFAVLGNHEYDNGNAEPTWDYFGDRAGPRGKGYYSVDIGAWHIIVLNDNPTFVPFNAGSEQDLWLQADLAANTKACTMAIWHQPMVMSSNTGFNFRSTRKILWDRLYAAGADVVLSGHQHFYERFAPMDPNRQRDDALGLRAFIVGTGGERGDPPTIDIAPNSEVRGGDPGVIKFTLRDGGYDWEFVSIPGGTFTDSGSGTCHAAPVIEPVPPAI